MRAKYSVFFVNYSYLRRLKSISPIHLGVKPDQSEDNEK